jgi:ribosomal 30S subunit maturation factor RimM
VVNHGSNDILEIKPSESSVDENSRKIPYVKDVFIKKVKLNENIIEVEWPKDF